MLNQFFIKKGYINYEICVYPELNEKIFFISFKIY